MDEGPDERDDKLQRRLPSGELLLGVRTMIS